MLEMASTIGVCVFIIWFQSIKLIKQNKELEYYKNKTEMLENVLRYDYSKVRGHQNETADKDSSRKAD